MLEIIARGRDWDAYGQDTLITSIQFSKKDAVLGYVGLKKSIVKNMHIIHTSS